MKCYHCNFHCDNPDIEQCDNNTMSCGYQKTMSIITKGIHVNYLFILFNLNCWLGTLYTLLKNSICELFHYNNIIHLFLLGCSLGCSPMSTSFAGMRIFNSCCKVNEYNNNYYYL